MKIAANKKNGNKYAIKDVYKIGGVKRITLCGMNGAPSHYGMNYGAFTQNFRLVKDREGQFK